MCYSKYWSQDVNTVNTSPSLLFLSHFIKWILLVQYLNCTFINTNWRCEGEGIFMESTSTYMRSSTFSISNRVVTSILLTNFMTRENRVISNRVVKLIL